MIITSINDLLVQYDAALSLMRVEWVAGFDTGCVATTASQMLDLARARAVRHLLIDMDSVPDIPVYDQIWMGTHFMPSLTELGLARLVLIISSHAVHNQLAVDALYEEAKPGIRFESHYFSRPEEAMGYLTDTSPRLPALLAEWATARQSLAG